MKRIINLFAFLLWSTILCGQSPNLISYQAVVHDADNKLVTSKAIGVRVTILKNENPVYIETRELSTNQNGLISFLIGEADVDDNFGNIVWGNGEYYIKTEIDPTTAGGANYSITGISQLVSVPYSLHSNVAKELVGESGNKLDEVYSWGNHSETGYLLSESQDIWISNDTIYLTGGSFVKLPETFSGDYADLLNKPAVVSDSEDGLMSFQDKVKLDTTVNVNIVAGNGIEVTGVYPDISISTKQDTLYLGKEYSGGIIFYLYTGSDGKQHGLVVSKTSALFSWQSVVSVTNASRTDDGFYNTNRMTGSPAKSYVMTLGEDWYLPSIDELSLMFHNRFHINKTLRILETGLLSVVDVYWSSTEFSTNLALSFYNGEMFYQDKVDTLTVRAIKAF